MNEQTQQAIEELLELLRNSGSRKSPKAYVEQHLSIRFSPIVSSATIQQALDCFLIDQVIDYPSDVPDEEKVEPIWFLKLLDSEESSRLRTLKPVDLAIIQALRNHSDYGRIGTMNEDALRAQLGQTGFSREELRILYVPDKVDSHHTFEDNEWVKWCYLIPEYQKTEEYKRREEEMLMKGVERESMEIRMHEESEKEEIQKQKRKARATKKASHAQSL